MLPLAVEPTTLQVVWFILIAVLWIGYLVLEGFDYGVAMLIPFLGKTEKEKRVIVHTVGPVWDGNEVWLLTAGGAMFAAFPGWYATLFSGLYLPLFLILVGLIIRGVAFEYRSKRPDTQWRTTFDWMACIGSFVVALVFGVAFGNFVYGLPVAPAAPGSQLFVLTPSPYFFQLFVTPLGLLCGIVLPVLFLFHGSVYLALKTKGVIHDRAEKFAQQIGWVALAGGAVFLVLSNLVVHPTGLPGLLLALLAAVALGGAVLLIRQGRDGAAFVGTTLTILFVAMGIFLTMWEGLGFKDAMGGAESPLNRVTAASTDGTLMIMLVAAGIFVPIVLAYQGWVYWVFRKRISVHNIPDDAPEPALAS